MKKLIEKKLIFIFTCMDGQNLTWKDLKYIKDVKFKDSDIVTFEYGSDPLDPAYDIFKLRIYREVEETDEQFANRIKAREKAEEDEKKARYEYYLKLKAEFDS